MEKEQEREGKGLERENLLLVSSTFFGEEKWTRLLRRCTVLCHSRKRERGREGERKRERERGREREGGQTRE